MQSLKLTEQFEHALINEKGYSFPTYGQTDGRTDGPILIIEKLRF